MNDAHHKVVRELKAALLDQRATAVFYGRMSDISRTYAGVEAFSEARKDELDHAREITQLLIELTGTKPEEATRSVYPPAFRNYCEGIIKAIEGERRAIEEYSNILCISPYQKVNNVLEEILDDEEYHLAKFNKLYQLECLKGFYHWLGKKSKIAKSGGYGFAQKAKKARAGAGR